MGRKRVTRMDERPLDVVWTPPLPALDPPWEQRFPIDESRSYVLKQGFNERNQLAEWAVIQTRVGDDGREQRVAVYDHCHGKGMHVHFYDRHEREFCELPLAAVRSQEDLEKTLDDAVIRVSVEWDRNERRSARGR